MEQEESAYITSLHLKGYKSIRDVSVTLNKGLNILIGANGSGKTNFLEFLDAAYRSDYEALLNSRTFESEVNMQYSFSRKMKGERVFQGNIKYRVEIDYGDDDTNVYFLNDEKKIVKKEESNYMTVIFDLTKIQLLRFNNPLNSILNEKLTLNLSASDLIYSELKKTKNSVNTFLNKIFDIDFEDEAKIINTFVEIITKNQPFKIDNLQENLKLYTPIKDFKIDWSLVRSTKIDEDENFITGLLEGIDFQFFVNNEWINWSQLSDGTKRLFYLIGSVTYAEKNEIILIEEPELGVHPHQLSLLMNFLMSKSAHNQIIISTHSPQVLNSLGEDELDNIIVARHEGKEGTKMYHLSEEEKGYATEYMKNVGFLSDYWMMSGFMQEENPEYI